MPRRAFEPVASTIRGIRQGASSGRGLGAPAGRTSGPAWAGRYGSETVVLSPALVMVKVPEAVEA
jgi:hypothetical protein